MGPAIATKIILNSSLKNYFELIHLNTKVNKSLSTIGKWSFKKVFRNYSIYLNMIKLIRKERPSLVLIPFSQDTIPFIKDSFFILIAKFFNKKVVLHLRGSNLLNWLRNSSSLTRWYASKMLKLSDGVIVLGNNLRHLFENYLPKEKIFVVPNGGDYMYPSRTDIKIRILYFANLFRAKGIEDVLQAIKILDESGNTKFQLDVVGDWLEEDTKKKCLSFVEANRLPVKFHEPKSGEGKLFFFANSDVFIFTPRDPEGHPWVIVEAMAAGLPIIATDKGAIVESVHHGDNGFIVNDQAPVEIAERLKQLLDDDNLRSRMAKKSRIIYEENFTESKMIGRFVDVFNKVISE